MCLLCFLFLFPCAWITDTRSCFNSLLRWCLIFGLLHPSQTLSVEQKILLLDPYDPHFVLFLPHGHPILSSSLVFHNKSRASVDWKSQVSVFQDAPSARGLQLDLQTL